jgi:plastocyanin
MGTTARLFALAAVTATVAGGGVALADDLTADFTWSPSQPKPGQTVTFTAESNGDIKTYEWDLDGNGEANYEVGGQTASRSFDRAGTYKIRVRVTDTGDRVATRSKDVKVYSDLKAAFTWSPQSPVEGDTVTLTSTSTSSSPITSWLWDLDGNGKFNDAAGQQIQKSFVAADQLVGLRVQDDTGSRASDFETIKISPRPAAPPPPPPPAGQKWLNPFPSIRIRGQATAAGAHLSMLAVRAPVGSNVEVRCSGSKRCPRKRTRNYVMEGDRLRLKGHERFFPTGTILKIFIWKPGEVGKYTRFRFRRNVAPVRTDRCLYPGGKWPGRCPR